MAQENVTAQEFIDDAEIIAEISEMVGQKIAVDYSSGEPILKINGVEFKEHDWVAISASGEISNLLKDC